MGNHAMTKVNLGELEELIAEEKTLAEIEEAVIEEEE